MDIDQVERKRRRVTVGGDMPKRRTRSSKEEIEVDISVLVNCRPTILLNRLDAQTIDKYVKTSDENTNRSADTDETVDTEPKENNNESMVVNEMHSIENGSDAIVNGPISNDERIVAPNDSSETTAVEPKENNNESMVVNEMHSIENGSDAIVIGPIPNDERIVAPNDSSETTAVESIENGPEAMIQGPTSNEERLEASNDSNENVSESNEKQSNEEASGETPLNVETIDTDQVEFVGKPGDPVNYRYVPGRKMGTKVFYSIDERQKYKINRTTTNDNGETYKQLTCCQDGCSARIWLYDSGRCIFSPNHKPHTHSSTSEATVKYNTVMEANKQEAATLKLVNGKLQSLDEIFRKNVTEQKLTDLSFKKASKSMYKARKRALPQTPTNVAQIDEVFKHADVMTMYGMTNRIENAQKTPFFKGTIDEEKHSACVFASDDIIRSISETSESHERLLYSDATFYITPKGIFTQVLILFAAIYGYVVPFAWVLMTNKSQDAYESVFRYINDNVMSLECAEFMSDYETALRNAFSAVVPGAKMSACFFHFCQACKRNAMKLPAMIKLIRSDSTAEAIYYKLLCLPLLPADQIVPAFNMLKSEAFGLNKAIFAPFFKYYENQWLKREGADKITVFDLIHRTTGSVEAYNGVLGKLIPTKSNLFQFITKLQLNEQKKAFDANLLAVSGGESAESQKLKSKIRNTVIQTATDSLKQKKINFNAFLKRVTFDKKKVCDNMLSLETVDPLDEDDIFDQLDYEHEDPQTAGTSNDKGESSTARLCVICKSAEPNCTLLPCRHQCVCTACFSKWNQADTSMLDALPETDNYDDVEIFHRPQSTQKPYPDTRCPVCQELVTDYIESILS